MEISLAFLIVALLGMIYSLILTLAMMHHEGPYLKSAKYWLIVAIFSVIFLMVFALLKQAVMGSQ